MCDNKHRYVYVCVCECMLVYTYVCLRKVDSKLNITHCGRAQRPSGERRRRRQTIYDGVLERNANSARSHYHGAKCQAAANTHYGEGATRYTSIHVKTNNTDIYI